MPPIKLSKIAVPPRPGVAAPVGLPSPVSGPADGLPDPTLLPDPGLAGGAPTPVDVSDPGATAEPTLAAPRASVADTAEPTETVEVPTAVLERLWQVVDDVPGLTMGAALTLALQQFLASLPQD